MSFLEKKVTPLQSFKDDGVEIGEKKDSEIPESPEAITVALERKETYSFCKYFAKAFKF